MNLTLRHVPQFPHAWPVFAPGFITTARLRQVTFNAELRADIQRAAGRYNLAPALIASVLADERVRLNAADRIQDRVMRLANALPSVQGQRLLNLAERLCGRSAETFSLGRSQMKPTTLALLGHLGYLPVPTDPQGQRGLLLDNRRAPVLVAACLRATADHWRAGGVNIEGRPDVLGTLYSLGLTGPRGVHSHPQANARGGAIAAHARWLEERRIFCPAGVKAIAPAINV